MGATVVMAVVTAAMVVVVRYRSTAAPITPPKRRPRAQHKRFWHLPLAASHLVARLPTPD